MTLPKRTRKAYQEHYEEKLSKRNQKIRMLEPVTIRRIEEQRMEQESPEELQEQPMEQESHQEQKPAELEDYPSVLLNQENEGPQKINPVDFLTKEDEGPQENYELEFLGTGEPTTLEIDTMDILEQLKEKTGPPTVHLRKTNVSTELAAKENLTKQEKPLKCSPGTT